MTGRERWDAAVALQHAVVAEVDALPFDDDGTQRFCDIMNAATDELEAAAEEAGIRGKEFSAAYRIHREAFIRRNNNVARHMERGTERAGGTISLASAAPTSLVLPPDKEWDMQAHNEGMPHEPADYVDGWNDALDEVRRSMAVSSAAHSAAERRYVDDGHGGCQTCGEPYTYHSAVMLTDPQEFRCRLRPSAAPVLSAEERAALLAVRRLVVATAKACSDQKSYVPQIAVIDRLLGASR